jgi:serine/threonine protein phosphatase PrpC
MNFFQRLFSQPKTSPAPEAQAADNGAVDSAMQVEESPATGQISRLVPGLHVGRRTDIGKLRERNEDALYTAESLILHSDGQEPFGLFIVADGMGGHEKGELASSLAIRTAANHILRDVYLPYLDHSDRSSTDRPINEALMAAVESANTAVQDELPEGGTTLTVALVMGNSAYIAHVGDTRAYLFTQDGLKQITKDHSYVQRLIELGQETAESALTHPHRNVLYRALGQGSTMEVDTYVQYLPPGSSLVLCSDGLWGLVGGDSLKEIITVADTPQEACDMLVDAANSQGGEDNISVIIVSRGVEG